MPQLLGKTLLKSWTFSTKGGSGGVYSHRPWGVRYSIVKRSRLATYHHGDSWTVEPQYPTQVNCSGEVDGRLGTWHRALTSQDGRTTRQDADWIRAEASRLSEAVKQGQPAILPVVSYYGTGRL